MCTENSILIDYVTESPKEVDAAGIIPCSDLPQTSNNIIQKGLAFVREQSGSVTVPGTRRASGSCPAGCMAKVQLTYVRFSNRPFGVKHFQTIHLFGDWRCERKTSTGLTVVDAPGNSCRA